MCSMVSPPELASRCCSTSRSWRSLSLPARICACASRAAIRPFRLPRIIEACARVLSKRLASVFRRSLVCASRVPGSRSSALPLFRPSLISPKLFRSLPSRNTASGLMPSMVTNSLALLPMRCVSITSWPAAASSAAAAPCCSFSDATVSAMSSRSLESRVDRAQRQAGVDQHLLLRQHRVGTAFGAGHLRQQHIDRFAHRRCRRALVVRAGQQRAHVLRQHVRALAQLGEGRRHADDGLRDRLGHALRLHQRLAGGRRPARRCGWPCSAPAPCSSPARARRSRPARTGCAAAAPHPCGRSAARCRRRRTRRRTDPAAAFR